MSLLNCADVGLIVHSSNFHVVWCMSTCRDAVFFCCYIIIYNKSYILSFILAAILVLIIKLVFISILNFFTYEHASSAFLHQLQLDENSISFLHHQLISLSASWILYLPSPSFVEVYLIWYKDLYCGLIGFDNLLSGRQALRFQRNTLPLSSR